MGHQLAEHPGRWWHHDGRCRPDVQANFSGEIPIERDLHRVDTGQVQRKVDHGDDRNIHLENRIWTGCDIEIAVRRPQRFTIWIHPRKAEPVIACVLRASFQANDEMGSRVNGRKSRDCQRIEHAEYVEFSFLRQVRAIGEYSKRDVHRRKVAGAIGDQLVLPMPESQTLAGFSKTDGLLFLMAVIWAVNFSVVKFATGTITPLAFTGLRVMLAAVVLLGFVFTRKKPLPTRREIFSLMALGALGNGLYQVFFVEGVSRTTVANAALIVAATPAFIAIVSRVGGVERVSKRVHAGIGLSLAGVVLVVLGSATSPHGTGTFVGTLLVFCGTICWTAFTVLLGPFARKLDPVQLSGFTMLGGIIPLLVVTPPALIATDWSRVGIAAWGAVLYASVISMGVAYLFWYRGLRVLGPTRTAAYSNIQPVIAILVAWIFLSESPTAWQGVGTATIITGLFLTRS